MTEYVAVAQTSNSASLEPHLHARHRSKPVSALLGPTNTGKTHTAIERMLTHTSGIIGLPLRLLAREVYQRVCEKVNPAAVALITGEERIKPKGARYWISTVEAMPRDIEVDFLALDEIQLASDLDRGHIFTDRLLHRRGRVETLLIGSATMTQAVQTLLPGTEIVSRPRLSTLSFAGEKKISRLPPRTAIVAFSAEEVYVIAEWIRRHKGGAAVVLGALSPRTRNAQVALYQSGEVDYIVATDAIGMGLNLDLDHIAFAGDRKFDGWHYRRLLPAEFGQIAGRSGRFTKDGTFGTTARCPPLEAELVNAIEAHYFDSVGLLQWRNSLLDFSSIAGLMNSLDRLPEEPGLTRSPIAIDQLVLHILSNDQDILRWAATPQDVRRLWEVCQLPDYRRLSPAAHAELARTIYRFVVRAGKIPEPWIESQIAQVDRLDGDIDALSARIAHVRTWTFVANHADWLKSPEHWQEVTRLIEDRLSDTLHERLTQRFIDRRTSVLMRRLRENAMEEAEVTPTGEVTVVGQHIGHLLGFRFTPDPGADIDAARTLNAAAQKALAKELESRAQRVHEAVDEAFLISQDGLIRWLGEPIGILSAGDHILKPRVMILADDQLTGEQREMVQRRLDLWISQHISKLLGPLQTLESDESLSGIARGIAFQLAESLGVLERSRVIEPMRALDQDGRSQLRKFGVRFGAFHLFLPLLLKPAPRSLTVLLWGLKHPKKDPLSSSDDLNLFANAGRTSFPVPKEADHGFFKAAGFRICQERAVRVDILERLADLIRPAIAYHPGVTPGAPPPGAADGNGFVVTMPMTSLTGCSGENFAMILHSLGYVSEKRPGPAITVSLVEAAPRIPFQPKLPKDDTILTASDSPPTSPPTVNETSAPQEASTPSILAAPEPGEVPAGEDLAKSLSHSNPSSQSVSSTDSSPGEMTSVEPKREVSSPRNEVVEDIGSQEAVHQEEVSNSLVDSSERTTTTPETEVSLVNNVPSPAASEAVEPVLIEVWHQQPRHRTRRPHDGEKDQRRHRPNTLHRTDRETNRSFAKSEPGAPNSQTGDPTSHSASVLVPSAATSDVKELSSSAPRPHRSGHPRSSHTQDPKGKIHRSNERHTPPRPNHYKPKERQPDPNSPFAKLAALKAQLENKPKND